MQTQAQENNILMTYDARKRVKNLVEQSHTQNKILKWQMNLTQQYKPSSRYIFVPFLNTYTKDILCILQNCRQSDTRWHKAYYPLLTLI